MNTTQHINIFELIRQNNIEAVKLLLENGTNTNIQNIIGYTPLCIASRHNKFEIVKLLLEYCADPNLQDKYGQTPLILASYFNRHDIIMLLIDYGADCYLINNDGKTVFDYKGCDFIKEYLESKEHHIVLK